MSASRKNGAGKPSKRRKHNHVFTHAVKSGKVKEVRRMISEDPAVVYQTLEPGITMLMVAAIHSQADVAQVLLESCEDKEEFLNMRDKDGWNALDWSESFSKSDNVKNLLLKHGISRTEEEE